MIKDLNTILKEIANLPEMENNTISIIFAEHPDIDFSKKERAFDILLPLYNSFKGRSRIKFIIDEAETKEVEKYKGDYRIRNVKISNIRCFPKSKKPFGIDFTENSEPTSIIILGTNGVGKSSIYNAIEFSYCRRVGEAELRTSRTQIADEDKYFKEYLTHFNSDFSEANCVIETNKKQDGKFVNIDIQKEYFPEYIRNNINPDTHFISDFDIYERGKLNFLGDDEQSFHHLIAKSIGLTELLNLNRDILNFIYYRREKEKRTISSLEKEIKTLRESISNWEKSYNEKKTEIENTEKQRGNAKEDEKLKQVAQILSRLKQKIFSIDFNTVQFSALLNEYSEIYNRYNALSAQQQEQNEYDFLNFGLQLIDKYNSCPFCNASNRSTEQLKEYVTKRIKEIKEVGEIKQKLSVKANEVISGVDGLLSQIDKIEAGVVSEVEMIKELSEFAKLLQDELKFISLISSNLSNDFFSSAKLLGGRITENQKEKFARIKQFEEANAEFIRTQLPLFLNKINQFIELRLADIAEVEKSLSEKSQQLSLIEKISVLKKEMSDIETQIKTAKTRITEIEKEIETNEEILEQYNKIRNEVIEYQKVLEREKDEEVRSSFKPIENITVKILNEYFKNEGRNVKLSVEKKPVIDTETGEIISEIIVAKITRPEFPDEAPLTPNKYFNTFHYRLFCAMVGISIAVASRKRTEINLPLVLDDIFYASDFKNRSTIEGFINYLIKVFKKFTPEQPLQLILFTHDELIFECATNTILENNHTDVVFSKLFHYSEAEEKEAYKELSLRIPTKLPEPIFEALR